MSSNTEHFVAPVEETPLLATDTVKTEQAPLSLWADAWRKLRRRPMFIISALLILLLVVVALFPGLFTNVEPNNDCQLANPRAARRRTSLGLHAARLRRLLTRDPRNAGFLVRGHPVRALRHHHRRYAGRLPATTVAGWMPCWPASAIFSSHCRSSLVRWSSPSCRCSARTGVCGRWSSRYPCWPGRRWPASPAVPSSRYAMRTS